MKMSRFVVALAISTAFMGTPSLSAQNDINDNSLQSLNSTEVLLGDTPHEISETKKFYNQWIKGKLSIGVSYSVFTLSAGERPANREDDFLGNINELHDANNKNYQPSLSYQVCDYFLVGVSYCHIEARTMNFNNSLSDGNAILSGPIFTAELSYPLFERRIIPHAGFGVAILKGDFEEDTWWNLGYSSPKSWEYYSSPTTETRQGYYRYIDVDDESAVFFAIGLAVRPIPNIQFDVSYRKLNLNPYCEFGYDYSPSKGIKDKHRDGDFDLSGGCWIFSLSYVF